MDKHRTSSQASSKNPEQIVMHSVHIDKLTINLREKPQLTPAQEAANKKIVLVNKKIAARCFFIVVITCIAFSMALYSPNKDFFDTLFYSAMIGFWVFFVLLIIFLKKMPYPKKYPANKNDNWLFDHANPMNPAPWNMNPSSPFKSHD